MALSPLSIDFKRLNDEIKYINGQFQNLRTFIVPDTKSDRRDLFYFAMFPADGSLSVHDIPLVGKMFIARSYPRYPPCLHLFNKTGRFNVDVFWEGENSSRPVSSMCFDILGRENEEPYGIGNEKISWASVFASLLQAIVSFKVPQKGSNYEREEAVSMSTMVLQHKSSEDIWKRYQHLFAKCPQIAKTHAKRVKVHKPILFQKDFIPISFTQGKRTYTSTGFRLNSADFCVQIDLTDFRKFKHMEHRYNFVVSFIISNSQTDVVGRNPQTILIRNGITGTAAKKLKFEDTIWFYHGQPLIDYSVINLTVSHGQVTMVVENDAQDKSDLEIHGDTVLSYLSTAEIGKLDSSEIFYLNICVEAKNTLQLALGEPTSNGTPKITGQVLNEKDFAIRVNTHTKYGFIHPNTSLKPHQEEENQVEALVVKESRPAVIDLGKLKDGLFELNLDNFDYFKAIFEAQKPQTSGNPSKTLRLDECQAYYLRNLVNHFERRHKKDIYLRKVENKELEKTKLVPSPRPTPILARPPRPQVQSTSIPQDSGMSPAEFWAKLRLDKAKSKTSAPVNIASYPVQMQSVSDRVQSDQEALERIAASILTTVTDVVAPPNLKYSAEYLKTVTFVGIDLGANSFNIYQDALDMDGKTHLMSKYDRLVVPGHVTLAYYRDFFMRQDFADFLQSFNENELILTKIVGYVHDDNALALLVEIDQAQFAHSKVYPVDRNLHVTVAVKSGVTPVYSNKLIQHFMENVHKPQMLNSQNISLKLFEKPLQCIGSIKFYF